MRRFAFVCAVAAAGCGQLTGLSEYTESESKPQPDSPDPVAYLDGAECRACLDMMCRDKEAECDANPDCRQTLECRRQCTDPNCHFQCTYPWWDDKAWTTGDDPRPADTALGDCALKSCRTECSIGRSWSCVGRYDWKTPPDGDLSIRHRAFQGFEWGTNPIANAAIDVCNRTDPACSSPLVSGSTDGDGRFTGTIPNARDFDVYLSVEHPDFPNYTAFGKQKPRFSGEYTAYGMMSQSLFDFALASVHRKFDPTLGYMTLQFYDCALFQADDLVVDLEVSDGGELRPCSSCLEAYAENKIPSLTAEHTSPDFAMVVFADVEPARAVITARDRSSNEHVARFEFSVQGNRVYGGGVMPLTGLLAAGEK